MLKKILLSFASLLGLVLVVGLALPSQYRVERSTVIRAPSEAVYARVADLERWREWTPWHPERFPDTQWMFGSGVGVGAVRSWSHPRTGRGTLSLTQADPKTGVAYDTSMEGGYLMQGRISFAPEDSGTRVTWVEEGGVGGNPLLHYLVPLLRARLGAHFEQGLARLQTQVEASPLPTEAPPESPPAPVEQARAPAPSTDSASPAAPVKEAPAEGLPVVAPPAEAAPVVVAPAGEGAHAVVLDAGLAAVPTAPGGEPAPAPTAAEAPLAPVAPAPVEGASAVPASTSVTGPAVPPS